MYYVTNITIPTNFFTNTIGKAKLNKLLADKINSIVQEGYEIVTVIPLNNDSKDFEYQIIYKDPEKHVALEGDPKEVIESKETPKSTPKESKPIRAENNYDDYEVIDTSIDTITDDDFDYDSSIDIGDEVIVVDDTIREDYLIKKYSIGKVVDIRIAFGGKEYVVEFNNQLEISLRGQDIVLYKH